MSGDIQAGTGEGESTRRQWKVLIADDEPLARTRLRTLLARHPQFDLVAECGSGPAVLAALRNGQVDLLLLDIRMPGLDGVATAEALAREAPWTVERAPLVVFVTASPEHAVRAFDLEALDYLVKPVDIDRFDRTMQRVLAALGDSSTIATGVTGAAEVRESDLAKRLVIRDAQGMYFVPVADVDRLEADGNYVAVIAAGKRHLIRESLQLLASRLDPQEFVRIHRSHVLRIERIQRFEPCGHGEYDITLVDGTRLTSSRSYKEELRRLLR